MTATTVSIPTTRTASALGLWARGALAGVVASIATVTVAAVAHAAGVSLAVGGDAIPLEGFAQMTFLFTMLGTAIAVAMRSFARRPRVTFVKTTVALTALSLIPDAMADAHTSTRLVLGLTHVIAAAIVIPAVAARLAD